MVADVKIFQPSKTAMQSGRSKSNFWQIEFNPASKRTPERLMGWQSSQDTLNQVKLKFESLEDAISFAQKKNWTFDVDTPKTRIVTPRNYGDNFIFKGETKG